MTSVRWRGWGHCDGCRRTPSGRIFCHRCETHKLLSEFYPDRAKGPGNYHPGCKDCRRVQSREWHRAGSTGLSAVEMSARQAARTRAALLGALTDAGSFGTTVSALMAASGRQHTTVTRMLKLMSDEGLVDISPWPSHAQTWRVRLAEMVAA